MLQVVKGHQFLNLQSRFCVSGIRYQSKNQVEPKTKQNKEPLNPAPSLLVSTGIGNVYRTFHSYCLITWLGLVLKRLLSLVLLLWLNALLFQISLHQLLNY